MPRVREWVNEQVRERRRAATWSWTAGTSAPSSSRTPTLKIFLVADPWERARRRLMQRLGRASERTRRSPRRPKRSCSATPRTRRKARPAADAVLIDTTYLTQEEQVERIVALARAAVTTADADTTRRQSDGQVLTRIFEARLPPTRSGNPARKLSLSPSFISSRRAQIPAISGDRLHSVCTELELHPNERRAAPPSGDARSATRSAPSFARSPTAVPSSTTRTSTRPTSTRR